MIYRICNYLEKCQVKGVVHLVVREAPVAEVVVVEDLEVVRVAVEVEVALEVAVALGLLSIATDCISAI